MCSSCPLSQLFQAVALTLLHTHYLGDVGPWRATLFSASWHTWDRSQPPMTALVFRRYYEFHWELEIDVVELTLMVHLAFKTGAGSILHQSTSWFITDWIHWALSDFMLRFFISSLFFMTTGQCTRHLQLLFWGYLNVIFQVIWNIFLIDCKKNYLKN